MLRISILIAAISVAALSVAGCATEAAPQTAQAPLTTKQVQLSVEGMTCASCSVSVRTTVNKLDGIVSVDVDVDGGAASVTYDPAQVTAQAIADQITKLGYTATIESTPGNG